MRWLSYTHSHALKRTQGTYTYAYIHAYIPQSTHACTHLALQVFRGHQGNVIHHQVCRIVGICVHGNIHSAHGLGRPYSTGSPQPHAAVLLELQLLCVYWGEGRGEGGGWGVGGVECEWVWMWVWMCVCMCMSASHPSEDFSSLLDSSF